jgi:hypothetical protein
MAANSGGRCSGFRSVNEHDPGVDAGDEGFHDAAHLRRTVRFPFRLHIPAIEEQACGTILREEARTEISGEQAEAALAPEIDLPQPVAGGVQALQEEHIVPRARADVRNAPAIHDDFRGPVESRDSVFERLRHGDLFSTSRIKPTFPRWRADPPTWHAAYPPSDGFGNEGSAGMTPVAGRLVGDCHLTENSPL